MVMVTEHQGLHTEPEHAHLLHLVHQPLPQSLRHQLLHRVPPLRWFILLLPCTGRICRILSGREVEEQPLLEEGLLALQPGEASSGSRVGRTGRRVQLGVCLAQSRAVLLLLHCGAMVVVVFDAAARAAIA